MRSIAVLSRADELGAGRLSAMVSINEATTRLRNHPDLAGVCETVVPVAGLMGMGAMILRQADFTILRSIAARPQRKPNSCFSAVSASLPRVLNGCHRS